MKVLKYAAMAIGAAAILIPGVGQAIGGAIFGALGGVVGSTGTLAAAALTVSQVAVAALELTAISGALSLLGPKGSQGGEQTKWKADPFAGIPYAMGRTLVSGNIVYRRTHGSENAYETIVTVLGLGPFESIDTSFQDKATVTYSGGEATGTYAGKIWEVTQLGECPEVSALVNPVGTPPGWTSDHKLSGLAAAMNTWKFDVKEKKGLTRLLQPSWIVHAVKVYDPRLDDTYPGGSGSCRALDESTYVWSENPQLHALTWCLGRWQNGKRVAGIGASTSQIDIDSFVDGANLSDARGWTIGGQVYTRPDTPWNSLKAMCQAGGAFPVWVGGRISCVNQAPRVSLATIGPGDIVGQSSFSANQPRRGRINQVIPQFRSEAHDWEVVPADPVSIANFVMADGDERTREIAYPLVQDKDQVAQLAVYDIYESREAGPGTVPLGPAWLNYRVGDCLTFAPQEDWSQKVLVTGRGIDAQTGTVTYRLKGESDEKHVIALGTSGTAPPVPTANPDPVDPEEPDEADWTLEAVSLAGDGLSLPALRVSGGTSSALVTAVIVEYRVDDGTDPEIATDWISGGQAGETAAVTRDITSILAGTAYYVAISYAYWGGGISGRLILGPVTAPAAATGGGRLLLESGGRLLLESGDQLLLEA